MQIPVHKINERSVFIKWRDIIIDNNDIELAHRHDYFHIMVLKKVSGMHEIDFENYDSQNYSLHFVGKGRVHKVSFDTEVDGGALLFAEEIFDASENDQKLLSSFSFFKTASFPLLNLSKKKFDELWPLVQQIRLALSKDNFETAKYLLFAFLTQIRNSYNLQVKNVFEKKIAEEIIQLNDYLQKNAKKANDLSHFLELTGITNLRLNALCKKEFGKTALQLLHERKFIEAKRLLVYTDMQIKEIAYDCGFEDVAYFSRYFKKYTNQTPNEFRNSH